MDRKRANQIERYVLVAIGAGLRVLLVALVINDPHPTLARKGLWALLLTLAAGAFGGALPGTVVASGTPSAAAKAASAIGLALAARFISRWLF
jgi:hypothetical protein